MKNIILLLFVTFGLVQLASAQTVVGGGLNYFEEIGISANVYTNTDNIYKNTRAGGDFTYYFVDGFSLYEIAVMTQYMFINKDNLNVYGALGVSYLFVSGEGAVGSASAYNLGAGAEYGLGFANLFGEARYLLTNYGSSPLGINAGLRFKF